MMLIDTHAHYNLHPLQQDWKRHADNAYESGVQRSIVVGTSLLTSIQALQITDAAPFLLPSLGIHPTECQQDVQNALSHKVSKLDGLIEDAESDVEQLDRLEFKKVVAIGETGLDYYRLPASGIEREWTFELQRFVFEQQIALSKKRNLPLILHVRDRELPEQKTAGNAYWDALQILQKYNVQHFTLHCVSGPLSYVKAAVEMGGYMGFDGNITYPNAHSIREIFNTVPEDRRVLETDAPFLPPQEYRGKTCEPWMITKTAEYLKQELKCDPEHTTEHAKRLFHISTD